MAEHVVIFDIADQPITVSTGSLLSEAAQLAAVDIYQPCGGQGRCGRCAVQVVDGSVRKRSTVRLSQSDIAAGYVLACQAVVEGDVSVTVPPQEKIERRLTTDRSVGEVTVPAGYDPYVSQPLRRVPLTLNPPSIDDQIDDWSRTQAALRSQFGLIDARASLSVLQRLGPALREGDWKITGIINLKTWDCEDCIPEMIDVIPGHIQENAPLWGTAIDIGTTTVSVWLVDLITGEVRAQVAEYNQQITRGEDVISRIIYSSKNQGGRELRRLVLETINSLIERACKRVNADPGQIYKAAVAGNSTMIHLFLGIPAESIRLSPFITAVNLVPTLKAQETGLVIHAQAIVDCLPGVASYVGADISAGVLSSGMDETTRATLFMDVGTNGEIVLGSNEWLVTCACSAGPAFEGAGVMDGMRATRGAIEEVWINGSTFDPSCRVIGKGKPRGICGSGLISLIAELFLTGVVDKAGHINQSLVTPRIRHGEHGWEYVIAWAHETGSGQDIAINNVDIDNLLRAKAAIYAGITVLADSVGFPFETVEQVLIGGAFGRYINVEKAVQIGLLPDLPWENFQFLGNTSVRGAYLSLLDDSLRQQITEIAGRMTYIELSADNTFYEAFMSAMFLPHTDITRFPSVATIMEGE